MIFPINQLVDSRYIISRYVTSGGKAEIYEAHDTYTNKLVALKVIKDDLNNDIDEIKRIKNEARFASMFSSRHIIDVYNVGTYKKNFFISYEFLRGRTLKDYLDERGSLNKLETLSMMEQILTTVKHIHGRGVLHNDLKPDNLFLQYDGNIKIIDFGIASHINDEHDSIEASVIYCAPEVLSDKKYGVQSDIYSLGIILFELLTGRTPYMKKSVKEETLAHLNEPIPSIKKYIQEKDSEDLDYIIYKATARKLNKRYQNVEEFLKDIKTLLDGKKIKKSMFWGK